MSHTPQKSICILSTGGTIAMCKTSSGYKTESGHLEKAMTKIPELKNPDFPNYTIFEFDHPLDSANMTPKIWCQIGEHISKHYQEFDGFVVLHGTDTMAYTASALSFMLEHLNKPVILTGSQLPLFETRNDARENLINAILMAARPIPEVCIYFNNKLFRGNRSTKMDARSFDAFASPNFPRLGKVGTEILLRHDLFYQRQSDSFHLQSIEPVAAHVIKLFPGMSLELLESILKSSLQAIVLQTYGVGNAPENPRFIDIIREAVGRGLLIVNCSQCPYAKVRMRDYATGTALMETGVVSGGDMTTEAALTKIFYLFSKKLSLADIQVQISKNLCGELTS